MKILYVCDFQLNRHTGGKDRATRDKISALKEHCNSITIISAKSSKQYIRVLESFWIELKALFIMLKIKPDYVISRGYVGWLFQLVAKILGIKTAREVHSDIQGEEKLIPYKGFHLLTIRLMSKLNIFSDKIAYLRIFNHPDLMNWYHLNHKKGKHDFYTYNGYNPASGSNLEYENALDKFNLSKDMKYLVFIGAASKWHGIEYLVSLQKEFNKNKDKIQIICGGGDISSYDKENICININPLDDKGCADLCKVASLCLLPCKLNRVSPGSPLKLYDYICNKRYVAAPINLNGYYDEIIRYNVGIGLNFNDPVSSRKKIINFINQNKNDLESTYPNCPVTWSDRMADWVKNLKKSMN